MKGVKPGTPLDETERFWTHVTKTSGCWVYSTKNKLGRGLFWRRHLRRSQAAYRVAWEFAHGAIPDGLFICHKCDNPSCVRPDHLFLGTPLDNMRDKIQKGRDTRGEAVNTAKLTAEQVIQIRARRAAGASTIELAAAFGISRLHVYKIVNRQSWKAVG